MTAPTLTDKKQPTPFDTAAAFGQALALLSCYANSSTFSHVNSEGCPCFTCQETRKLIARWDEHLDAVLSRSETEVGAA